MEHGIVMELHARRVVGRRSRAAMVSCNAVVRAEEPGTKEGHRNGQGLAWTLRIGGDGFRGPNHACVTQIIHGKNSNER